MMNAFFKHLWIQFQMDIRERGTLMIYYLVPLVFYFIMGAVFSSINPLAKQTLSATMVIFAVTMGAVLGIPVPLVKMRETGVLRAFRVNGIPSMAVLVIHSVSAFFHLLIVSMIIFVTAPMLYGADFPANVAGYLGTLLLLLFTSIAIGMLIGVTARSQSMATMLSQVVFLPSLMLGGIMFPADMLPKVLQGLGYLLPATYIMQSFSALAFQLPVEANATLSLLISAGIGIIASVLTAVKFKSTSKSS